MSDDAVGVVFAKSLKLRPPWAVVIVIALNVNSTSGNAVVIAQRDVCTQGCMHKGK